MAQIEMHLDDKLPSVKFAKTPLRDFLDVIAEFSTLSITIDKPALEAVGKSPKSPVTLQLTDVTVAQALEAALSKHGLTTVVRGGKLVVTTPPASPKGKP